MAPPRTAELPYTGKPRTWTGRAFTTLELLTAVALLAITVIAVVEIFNISSETTSRTTAHTEVLAASAMLQQQVMDLLTKLEPGLLIIESPEPTPARSEIAGGPAYFRLRQDRLVFIASGGPGEFQSYTDPRRGTPADPTAGPATSPQALIYVGPGIPLANTGEPLGPRFGQYWMELLTASEWVLAHRAILFLLDDPQVTDWAPINMSAFTEAGGLLDGGELRDWAPGYLDASMDVVVSDGSTRADAAMFTDLIQRLDIGNLLNVNPDVADIKALWEPNWCPTSVTVTSSNNNDHYSRSGFAFQPGLADLRIEWTDGRRVDPLGPDGRPNTGDEDGRTRWFGLRPDPASPSNLNDPDALKYLPVLRQDYPDDTTAEEVQAFGMTGGGNRVEGAKPSAGGSAADAAYRAVWRLDTWQFRPKALRLTYRVYDPGNRLTQTSEVDLNEDGAPDPAPNNPNAYAEVTRFGQEFSIVVPVP